jgi:hypothetical protein
MHHEGSFLLGATISTQPLEGCLTPPGNPAVAGKLRLSERGDEVRAVSGWSAQSGE